MSGDCAGGGTDHGKMRDTTASPSSSRHEQGPIHDAEVPVRERTGRPYYPRTTIAIEIDSKSLREVVERVGCEIVTEGSGP